MEVVGIPSMSIQEYYKLMLRDYGYSREEVNEVVDADDSEDFQTIIERLHARHGLFVSDDEIEASDGTPETTPGGASVQTPI